MGIIYSFAMRLFGWEAEEFDEKIGLTKKQKKLARDSWQSLLKKDSDVGVVILIQLFKKVPEIQNEFQSFKGVPLDELSKSVKFCAHCRSIISALSSAIDGLDNFELMREILLAIGERHGRRSQNKQQFYQLKSTIAEVVKEKLGSGFTDEVANVWTKLLDMVFAQILEGLERSKS